MLHRDAEHQIRVIQVRFGKELPWQTATCPNQLWDIFMVGAGESTADIHIEYLSEEELFGIRDVAPRDEPRAMTANG